MANDESGLSSDDLLRQAREAFDPRPTLGQDSSSLASEPKPSDLAGSDLANDPQEHSPTASPPSTMSSDSLLAASKPALGEPVPMPDSSLGSASGLVSESAKWVELDLPLPSAQPPPPRLPQPSDEFPPSAMPRPSAPPAPGFEPPGSWMPPAPGFEPPPVAESRIQRAPGPPPSLGPPRAAPRAPLPPAPANRTRNIPWRPVVGISVFGILALIGAIAGRGTSSANSLGVGDCFANPGNGNFTRVTDQDCAGPHDIQIFAVVKSSSGLSAAQNADPDNPLSASAKCDAEILRVLASPQVQDSAIIFPDDVALGEIGDFTSQFSSEVFCIIESPSGALVGSVVP